MGELPFFRAHTALHPDHLWIWERSVYVDENQRTWLPITIEARFGAVMVCSECDKIQPLIKLALQGVQDNKIMRPLTESSLQVLMRQEDVSLGEAVCPSLLAPCPLPSMWQLYPGRRYRGSDSSFWRIVYHIEAIQRQGGHAPRAAARPGGRVTRQIGTGEEAGWYGFLQLPQL
ncbi:hypothetical protein PANDA_009272 [Ailuropoda melanoleuca]|uniref:T cell leukemia/lymphoma 1A n=1 Tax=Ailuropoda melanoleuca TaxID=9646 RepID=D2HEN7_AILME|nr:hypothetical protein PANDA_009272 [Ailuropoda melanoleuca]